MNDRILPLKRLEKLAEMSLMGCMVPTTHQDVVHEGKSGVQISEGVVHVVLKRCPSIPKAKRQPLTQTAQTVL
jgi:hypothetical protein